MGCFSYVTIAPELLPHELKGVRRWQTKDLPDDDETCFPYDDYYNGTIGSDGVFEREDGKWNPALAGWIRLVSDVIFSDHEIHVRFEGGGIAEVFVGHRPPGDTPGVSRAWVPRSASRG